MTSKEQLTLSNFIKSVHENLRKSSKEKGADLAWKEHCNNEETLKKYADYMQNLAQNYWELNSISNKKVFSRVSWIVDYCNYYFNEGILEQFKKERDIFLKIDPAKPIDHNRNITKPFKLLDVGSCYNPFKNYELFDVTPVDIAPATDDVFKCDFLNVAITSQLTLESNEIIGLTRNNWDVIVFSLFLEYLPSPMQRQICCDKAYELLKTEGILCIITPDSKHVHANSKIMKSWRFLLAKIGFSRIKYEKLPHLHCMVFRKSIKKEVPQRWAILHSSEQFYEDMVIPQDLQEIQTKPDTVIEDEICDVELFNELPFL